MIYSSFVLKQIIVALPTVTTVALPGWHAWWLANRNYSRDEDVVDGFTSALVDSADDMVRGNIHSCTWGLGANMKMFMLLADLGDVLSQ